MYWQSNNVSAFAAQLQTRQTPSSESRSNDHNDRTDAEELSGDSPPAKKPKIHHAATVTKPALTRQQKIRHGRKRRSDRIKSRAQKVPILQSRSGSQHPPADALASVNNTAPNAGTAPKPGKNRAAILDSTEKIKVQPSTSELQPHKVYHKVQGDFLALGVSPDGIQSEALASSSGVIEGQTPEAQQLSTFIPSEENVIEQDATECTINLRDDSLTLIGQYEIWVRKGAINFMGAILYPSSVAYPVYATSIHSLPSIKPIINPFAPTEQEVIITISNLHNGLRSLKHVSPTFDRIWNKADVSPEGKVTTFGESVERTFTYLGPSSDDAHKRPLRLLELPSDWQSLISAKLCLRPADQPKRILVCGPKGSGKSTFTRILINALLTKSRTKNNNGRNIKLFDSVSLLDMDPGQPEYSPPGEISLVQVASCSFGPPFCHPTANVDGSKHVVRSHHIGAKSPREDPDHYLQCVLDLLQCYRKLLEHQPDVPLIMNAPGWIQGKGLELLIESIHHSDPSDIIYTSTLGPLDVVESISSAIGTQTALHLVTSQPVEYPPRSAAILRMMQTLSYFHLDGLERNYVRWNSTPINEMPTIDVQYAGPTQSIFAVQLLGPELDPELLLDVLEGSIVGLVVIEDDAALSSATGSPQATASSKIETGMHSGVSENGGHQHGGSCEDPSLLRNNNFLNIPPSLDKPGLAEVALPSELQIPVNARRPPILDDDSSYMEIDADAERLQTPRPSSDFNPSISSKHEGQDPSTPSDIEDTALQFFTPASHLPASAPSPSSQHSASQLPHTLPLKPKPAKNDFHSHFPRTAEQIPYLPSIKGLAPPPLPSYSHSIGQAIIRSIDTKSQTFHLITPVPLITFNNLHKQRRKIILVKGNLDVPAWIYKEDLHMEMERCKQAVKRHGKAVGEGTQVEDAEVKEWCAEDTKAWAEDKPWVNGEGRGKGETIRRTRRDLGKKSKG
ncbi:MAG: hypothetical protein Q9220_006356 [cf. Caloplaca sp. 1 TL-2023]